MIMKHQLIVLLLLFSACLTQSHPERPHNPTPHSADHYPVSTAFKNEPATSCFSLTVTPYQHHIPLQQQRFPHPEVCIARIQSSARALETYQKISNIYLWINNINNRHLPVRIAARQCSSCKSYCKNGHGCNKNCSSLTKAECCYGGFCCQIGSSANSRINQSANSSASS